METKREPSVRPLLIADDCSEDLFFFRRKLARVGVTCPILSTQNGFETLHLLKGCRPSDPVNPVPSILFLDINMPGITGFSVLSWIRARDLLNPMKVVMVSGSDEPCDIELATELGANAYLIKFPSAEGLRQVLTTVQPTLHLDPVLADRVSDVRSSIEFGGMEPLDCGVLDPEVPHEWGQPRRY
jgi:CheY-like chemotaxis protein